MKRKILIMTLLFAILALRIAGRLAVVYAVAEPHANKGMLLKLAVNPPYEIASPHQGLLQDVRSALFPKVYAQTCSVGNCAKPGFKPVATCNPACQGCGNCPDCVNGPCTIYKCIPAATTGGCHATTNPDPKCALSCPNADGC